MMAFDGNWRECLQYRADCYKNLSSVRDSIEGERNIQGSSLHISTSTTTITQPRR